MRALTLAAVLALAVLGAGPRKTLFLDRMGGFEKYIEEALVAQELNVEVIEEEAHPDLKALIGKKFKSLYAEVLYKKNTGRSEDTELKAIDVKTGKAIVVHQFRMGDEESKKRAAREFVEMLRKKIEETR